MNKLITTLALTFGLLFGGLSLAAPANADEPLSCPPGMVCEPCPAGMDCSQESATNDEHPSSLVLIINDLQARVAVAEQTANDYRAQLAVAYATIERLERLADRQAATIQRLRAKIRGLR